MVALFSKSFSFSFCIRNFTWNLPFCWNFPISIMIVGQGFWKGLKYSWKYNAEEEFYYRLMENRTYPFEDLGNGFYYLQLKSDKLAMGICLIIFALTFLMVFVLILGWFAVPVTIFIVHILGGALCMYGHFCKRELIISRLGGYILRIGITHKILCEQEIYNVYIRLQKKTDSVQTEHFYLIIGGYLLDDIRISRSSLNEVAMRCLGQRLARNLGINFFDYMNETVRHVVYHYRGASKLKWKREDVAALFTNQTSKTRIGSPTGSATALSQQFSGTRFGSGSGSGTMIGKSDGKQQPEPSSILKKK